MTTEQAVRACRKEFIEIGMRGSQLTAELKLVRARHEIALLARVALDAGVPQDQGPIWYGEDAWKTDFWVRQWKLRKAYQEGEAARTRFDDRDSNPYLRVGLPMTKLGIELEHAWKDGFDGKSF